MPEPGTGEVLVEVHATAVTADELTWSDTWPVIPSHDMSGVVVASGGGVTDWPPGAEIYGLIGFDRPGAAAEYVTVRAADLAARPVAANPKRRLRSPSARSPPGRLCTTTPSCSQASTSWFTAGQAGSAPTQSSSPPHTAPG